MAPGLSDPGTWSLQPGRHPRSGKKKREMGLRAEDVSRFSKKQLAVRAGPRVCCYHAVRLLQWHSSDLCALVLVDTKSGVCESFAMFSVAS